MGLLILRILRNAPDTLIGVRSVAAEDDPTGIKMIFESNDLKGFPHTLSHLSAPFWRRGHTGQIPLVHVISQRAIRVSFPTPWWNSHPPAIPAALQTFGELALKGAVE